MLNMSGTAWALPCETTSVLVGVQGREDAVQVHYLAEGGSIEEYYGIIIRKSKNTHCEELLMSAWRSMLELDSGRRMTAGDPDQLASAIRKGADLRIGTAFRHNEHIDVDSPNSELIREVMDFRVVYLLEDRWVAGIQNLRMPVSLPDGFGPRPSMSFFLYNQDGLQGIARPFLDGVAAAGRLGKSVIDPHPEMPRYHELASWDAGTNAPSSSFIYDFEYFRYFVRESWQEVFSHDDSGEVVSGSLEELTTAFAEGCELKIAVRGLCDDLGETSVDHEVFIHLGACYYYTETKQLMASANPVVRTRPSIPLEYESSRWDFGWIMPRTDGHVARWFCDPYSLKFSKSTRRHAIRWFVSR